MKSLLFVITLSVTLYSQSFYELNRRVENFFRMSNFAAAEVFAEQAYEAAKKEFGTSDTNYLKAANNLATAYLRRLRFYDAEKLFIETLELKKKTGGTNNYSYATSLYNLADLYKTWRKFRLAEKYFLQAADIDMRVAGENSSLYAQDLDNLGTLYISMKDFDKAAAYLLKSAEIRKKLAGGDSPLYAISLLNYGNMFIQSERPDSAEKYVFEASEIFRKVLGSVHPYYINAVGYLGMIADEKKEYKKSDSIYAKAIEFIIASSDKNNPEYTFYLMKRGKANIKLGQLKIGADYIYEAFTHRSKIYSSFNPLRLEATYLMALVNYKMELYDQAEKYLAEVFMNLSNAREYLYPAMETSELEEIYTIAVDAYSLYNSLIMNKNGSDSKIGINIIDNKLLIDLMNPASFVIKRELLNLELIDREKKGELNFSDWIKNLDHSARLALLPGQALAGWGVNADSLIKFTENLRNDLVKKSPAFDEMYVSFMKNWEIIKKQFEQDEVLVYIIRTYDAVSPDPGKIVYTAIVIDRFSGDQPKIIKLNDGNMLEGSYLKYYTSESPFYEEKIINFENYWKPLADVLEGKKKVWFYGEGVYALTNPANILNPEKDENFAKLYEFTPVSDLITLLNK
ncbi:MAG: tetratricopeptide repeat protein [Ignavibacteriaceae bacterium]|nr:tetratricopeptide repeat protein [Ignavibacteriaceae bacterium]